MATSQAMQAIKAFRIREIKALPRYIRHHGPLPPQDGTAESIQLYNPFIPHKNPKTGKWIEPKYSRRRQAELIKKAKATGTLDLLPPGPRLPRPDLLAASLKESSLHPPLPQPASEEQIPKELPLSSFAGELWNAGLKWVGEVKLKEKPGAESGTRLYAGKKKMFKEHKWERNQPARIKKRKILLRDMAKRIHNYKTHYQKRRPDPLKPLNTLKAAKLPF